jgi:hypothetical protein
VTADSDQPEHRTLCPDNARLARYIDGALDDGERRTVQAHLVTCPACRDVVADTVHALSGFEHVGRAMPVRWLGGLAAAAAVLIGVYLIGWRGPRSGPENLEISGLVTALADAPMRPVEGWLAGGFPYAPPPQIARGRPVAPTSPAVVLAAADVLQRAAGNAQPDHRAAVGVANLLSGKLDEAIDALEDAARARPRDATFQNDLSVAYIARAQTLDRADDWTNALASADRAIAIAPRLLQALFNRALALDGLHRDAQAADAWAAFRSIAGRSPAESEAAEREQDARSRLR